MIEIDIVKRLGDFKLQVSFHAHAPVLALFGRSGAGKSTIAQAVAGLLRPDQGAIRVRNETLFDRTRGIDLAPERRRIGYVFQDHLLFAHLSVEKNLLYGYRLGGKQSGLQDPQRIIEVLGLEKLLERKPHTLSGGEKQRVSIGRALLSDPQLLILDEPLAALDAERKSDILRYIEYVRDEFNTPMLYISHSVDEVARIANVAAIIAEGECVAIGPVAVVMNRTDFNLATARADHGALIEARVAQHDLDYQLSRVVFDGGALWIPRVQEDIGQPIRVWVRAGDVTLATAPPVGLSTQNTVTGKIVGIAEEDATSMLVRTRVGRYDLCARITRRASEQLRLRVELPVILLIKAVSLER